MAKLRFYAKLDAKVSVPFVRTVAGQPALYIGRRFDSATRTHPAVESAYECDADSDIGRRLMKHARVDGSLWAADKDTADLCGIEFVKVQFKDGVWSDPEADEKAKKKAAEKAAAKKSAAEPAARPAAKPSSSKGSE